MEATVLSLTWPAYFDLSDFKRFETEARTLRYQALGRACKDKRINMLMVAHHGDDQAETVMMRLANNRLRSGLQAMHSVDWIPECEGIYGVHHSGKPQKRDPNSKLPFPVEQGGIQIMRPLLSFEKSRLIATCEEKGIAWAEDKTNQLPTVTSRNAIRHIIRNYKLPEALSIKSLIEVSTNMQKRIKAHKSYSKKLFDESFIKLDIQTGCALVRFPPVSSLLSRPIETDADIAEAKDNAYCLIEHVGNLVAPKLKPQLGHLAGLIEHIYPELDGPNSTSTDPGQSQRNRAVYGVWWRYWGDKGSPFSNEPASESPISHPRQWLLTRQPLGNGQVKEMDPANYIDIPPVHESRDMDNTYHLFDGRYWIQVRNLTTDALVLRLFEQTDMRQLPTAQQEKDMLRDNPAAVRPERFITAALSLLKPADLRFTLPAVFRVDATTRLETLVGFPTLDVRMGGFGAPAGICAWSVRYKKIDTGSRALEDVIVPGFSPVDIITKHNRAKMQARLKAKILKRNGPRGKKPSERGFKPSDENKRVRKQRKRSGEDVEQKSAPREDRPRQEEDGMAALIRIANAQDRGKNKK